MRDRQGLITLVERLFPDNLPVNNIRSNYRRLLKMNIGIYKITNLSNNKVYIGQSTKLKDRKYRHFSELRCGRHHNPHLQSSFNKFGESNFSFEIIEEHPVIELDDRERFWISFYDSTNRDYGFNMDSGGVKRRVITRESVESAIWKKIGIPAWNKGLKMSDEQTVNMKGVKRSAEFKKKMRELKIGVKLSEEHRKKIKLSMKGRVLSDEHKENLGFSKRKYTDVDLKKMILLREEGKTIKQIADEMGKSQSGVHYILKKYS